MKKITLLILIFISFNYCYTQSLYDRIWGGVGDIGRRIRIAENKPNTNDLYVVYDITGSNPNPYEENLFGEIYIQNPLDSSITLFYRFPTPIPLPPLPQQYVKYAVRIETIKFDSNENLIVYAKTTNPDLGTPGSFSSTPLPPTALSGNTLVAKINKQGRLVWLTYFYDLAQDKNSLTVDGNNNIYVLNKRHKSTALPASSFQSSGDMSSNSDYQEVISKLDTNGKHLWSTFYFNDKSQINSIVAAGDGLYVYGAYIGSNISNSFFSTKNCYQEYPSGTTVSNLNSTVFLSKFGFDGNRLWSTYFGDQVSRTPIDLFYNLPQSLTTVGNDAYILTSHKSPFNQSSNLATTGTYVNLPIHPTDNTTLTKFVGDGTRLWTTYLYAGSTLQKTYQNDLLVTSNIADSQTNITSIVTSNAYQSSHGGKNDTYTALVSNDGKTLRYGSFYGYDGNDNGMTIATKNGFYIYGHSVNNVSINSQFSTNNESFYGSTPGPYWGYFIGYFLNKTLNRQELEKELEVSIYPNPTTDVLNIQSREIFPENTFLTIYDISGKRVLNQCSKNSNLNQINVSNLNSGVYILQIDNPNINQSFKFIKK